MIEKLLKPEVQKFILEHLAEDPSLLVLQSKKYAHLPLQEVAHQIKARQKLKNKLPDWVNVPNLVFPKALSLEQSSSQKTAEYKSSLISGEKLIDLTGGMGVDSFYFSKAFAEVHYVEQNTSLFEHSVHNLKVLGARNIVPFSQSAENFLKGNFKADCIYIDPDRRASNNKKLVRLADCEPDVLKLLPIMLEKALTIIIKTSPLLDITEALRSLPHVAEIHILAVDNEVKEVLYVVKEDVIGSPKIVTQNLTSNDKDQTFSYSFDVENSLEIEYSKPLKFLYEPNASILKAGAFKIIASKYEVFKLHPNSHLYTSHTQVDDFPGRSFKIIGSSPYQKKHIIEFLPSNKANITVRNFPYSVAEIRKKTGIMDGGDVYIFATTDCTGKPIFLFTSKI